MKVWAVIETADYATVAIFASRELADAFVERDRRQHPQTWEIAPDIWVISEEDVLEHLPEPMTL